jgi:hypothetical protein
MLKAWRAPQTAYFSGFTKFPVFLTISTSLQRAAAISRGFAICA